MRRAYRRRRFLVDPFQTRLLAISLVHILAFGLLVAAALFLPLMMTLQDATISAAEKGRAADVFLALDARFWPTALVVLGLVGVHSLLVSHRIAGPLVGFRRVLRSVGQGDLSVRATIRRSDYLKQDAESINAMIAGLNRRLRDAQSQVAAISAVWTDLAAGRGRDADEETLRRLEAFGAQLRTLKAQLEQFRTHEKDCARG